MDPVNSSFSCVKGNSAAFRASGGPEEKVDHLLACCAPAARPLPRALETEQMPAQAEKLLPKQQRVLASSMLCSPEILPRLPAPAVQQMQR